MRHRLGPDPGSPVILWEEVANQYRGTQREECGGREKTAVS